MGADLHEDNKTTGDIGEGGSVRMQACSSTDRQTDRQTDGWRGEHFGVFQIGAIVDLAVDPVEHPRSNFSPFTH